MTIEELIDIQEAGSRARVLGLKAHENPYLAAHRMPTGDAGALQETIISALGKEPCMSMLGAALLHAGISQDIEELRRQCLVVKLSKTKVEVSGRIANV
ncbi:CrpP-related protein [Rhizobium leguminosarum]|uniref:CrpP-related protein n=1 Tax=Rhizobium leguminosarum TaxID=384 RepID=UPI0010300C01|nr:CrpP-related protein [Rhizobium leguminosarum]TBF40457.1 hypothetical protein ELG92_10475 [Rhizobium leguminosarum]